MFTRISLQIILLVFPVILFAQDNKGASFKDHLRAKEQQRKNDIKEYAAKHGIPVNGTGVNGEYMYLHHIDNDKPIYYTTRNSNDEGSGVAISLHQNEWVPLVNNVNLKKGDSQYLSIKHNEAITGLYIFKSDGKTFYRSKTLSTKHLVISTNKLDIGEYVICIKTAGRLSSYNIVVN